MRNRNWDRDFDEINQSNVNRFHTNRDGQRQYDSGYSNNMGQTSFEQHMSRRGQQGHQNRNPQQNRQNMPQDRYTSNNPNWMRNQDGFENSQRRNPYLRDTREMEREQGFFRNMGERVDEFIHDGRERFEQAFDRFGNPIEQVTGFVREGWNNVRHNFGRFGNEEQRQHQERPNYGAPQGNRQGGHSNRGTNQNNWSDPEPRRGYQNTAYHPNNQGQVQGHRYDRDDYSGRSSYRLLDTYSGYGQSGLSYASDRDDE